MEQPFKIGDTVLVRDDLILYDKVYHSQGIEDDFSTPCYDEHYQFKGLPVTIGCYDEIDGSYQIKEDGYEEWWAAEMFVPIPQRNFDAGLLAGIISGL